MEGELFRAVATVAFVAALIWVFNRNLGIRRRTAPDAERPYSVFTTEFDVSCRGREVSRLLDERGATGIFPASTVHEAIEERTSIADEAYRSCACDLAGSEGWPGALANQAAVVILVDQSGSMANRMPGLAGQLRAIVESLADAGVPVALLGFTTCGWRGGKSREKWVRNGRPAYPGRLCDLLHIEYKDFDSPLDDADWQAMLRADALFENLDGEALEWARARLEARAEKYRLLIAVSDGAPVDDSTLAENGATFLERHLLATIGEISESDSVTLGAIGIGHRVDRYYGTSEMVDEEVSFPTAFLNLTGTMLTESRTADSSGGT